MRLSGGPSIARCPGACKTTFAGCKKGGYIPPVTVHLTSKAPPLESKVRRWLFVHGDDRQKAPRLLRPLKTASWLAFSALLVGQNPAVDHPIRALTRYVRCQLMRRRGRDFEIDLGPRGRFICPSTSAIGSITAATGYHEPYEQSFAEAIVQADELVVDAGASIGFFTIPFAMGGANVLSFEPSEEALKYLSRNVEINRLNANVEILPTAVSDFVGNGSFTRGLDVENHLVEAGDNDENLATVPVTTIDHALERLTRFQGSRVAFIKLDVEGQDEKALAGARGVIETSRPVIMIETRLGGAQSIARLRELDYIPCWFDGTDWRLYEVPPSWQGNFDFHTNVLGIPGERIGEILRSVNESARPRVPSPRLREVQAQVP